MTSTTQPQPNTKLHLTPRQIAQILFFFVGMYLLPILISWDWGWVTGWVMLALMISTGLLSRVLMALRHPDLVVERARMLGDNDAKPWDKRLVPWMALYIPLLAIVVTGLDHRFGWTPPLGLGVQVAAVVVMLVGAAFGTWALMENRWFSAVVRIQTDRGHQVCDTGPYRFIRHPGYAGSVVTYLAMPFVYGTLWPLVLIGVVLVLLVYRTAREDATLHAELPGYKAYAQRVRYRLLPGVW